MITLNIITVSIGLTGLKSPDTQSSEAAFDETTCLLQEIDGIMGELNMKYCMYQIHIHITNQNDFLFLY